MIKEKYTLKELTPESMNCWPVPGCPAIYELKRKTPENMCPPWPGCPEIYEGQKGTLQEDKYLIIGAQINPNDFGLEKKVGEGEVLISVPRKLIDEKKD